MKHGTSIHEAVEQFLDEESLQDGIRAARRKFTEMTGVEPGIIIHSRGFEKARIVNAVNSAFSRGEAAERERIQRTVPRRNYYQDYERATRALIRLQQGPTPW